MADDQVIGVLEFRFDEEDGVVVVPFGGDEGIRIDWSVPPDPWVLLVFGWTESKVLNFRVCLLSC